MPGIGILSTVPYQGTPFETAFDNGLNMAAVTHRNYQDNLGYNGGSLNEGLSFLNSDPLVTLIIAVGGLVTELAAASASKQYISLVGAGSREAGEHFEGRVSLGSVGTNHARRARLLASHGIPFNRQCLLSNDFSAMKRDERRGTGGGGGVAWGEVVRIQISEDDLPAERQAKYQGAFGSVSGTMRAVIISADPYFRFSSNELVAEANNWVSAAGNRRVCYPFQEYGNDGPTATKTSLYGPSLEQGYEYLGLLAAHIIDNVNNPAPGSLPQHYNDV
jgi:hypothetical protein